MAYSKLSPQDFIQQTFPPMVAVMCTPCVEAACKKNNLSFVEMIRPFSKATVDGSLKDSSGTSVPIRNLRVSFSDINSRPPPLPIARSYFNDVINTNVHDRTVEVIAGDVRLDIPVSVPWFDAWRNTFLQVQYPSDHEFTKHYVACLLVVSSEDVNPVEKLKKMMTQAQELIYHGASKLPKWFTPPSFVLVSCLLLHDNTVGDSSICLSIMEEMKSIYGPNKCFYLCINSQVSLDNTSHIPDPWAQFLLTSISYKEEPKESETSVDVEVANEPVEKSSPSTPFIVHPLSPVTEEGSVSAYSSELSNSEKSVNSQHGRLLTAEDINKIKQFVNEFCLKALLPHFEQCIQILSDQISNKKGMSRSLFSATKRWFGTSKPGTPGNNISPTAIAYSSDSHELQLRRLGDFAFMIGHYLLAYTAYHGAKRDFSADGAWLHYAGALEMAALAAFMSGTEALSRKVIDYAEESITTYQTSCRVNQFATRATLLSVECLKGRGLYGEAAKQLIRMSGEDSDLRSAVLLEQAAYSFLSSRKPLMYRKYAFHMVLAGHRFNKAGHKNHSMRCYYQAYQVYEGKCWSVAEDHILFTIGKQASQLKLTLNAVEALSYLVKRSSRQTAQQQLLYLQEYITTTKQMLEDGEKGILSLPVIDCRTIQVLLNISVYKPPSSNMVPASSTAYDDIVADQQYVENSKWWKLEEKLVNCIEGGFSTMVFRPTIEILTFKTDNSSPSVVVSGEPIGICVNLRNPLHIAIKVCELRLLWSMKLDDECDITHDFIEALAETVPDFTLDPDTNKNVVLIVTPRCTGEFQVTGFAYSLADCEGNYSVFGMQPLTVLLPGNSQQTQDKRLQFKVIKKAPQLQVCFTGLRRHIFASEIVPMRVYFENIGNIDISRIFVISGSSFSFWIEGNPPTSEVDVFKVPLNGVLTPGQIVEIPIFIFPHFKDAEECLELLFYYESTEVNTVPRYRLIRHSWPTTAHNLFHINTQSSKSHSLQFKDEAVNIKMHLGLNTSESAPSPIFKVTIECISLYCSSWKLTSKSFSPDDFVVSKEESVYILLQAIKGRFSKDPLSTVHFTSETQSLPFRFCLPSLECKEKEEESSNIYCFINWKTDTSDEYGVHTVHGQECVLIHTVFNQIPPLPTFVPATLTIFGDSCADESSHLKKLIYYQLEHSASVKHDFLNNRLCTIPVTLWLHNSSDDILSVKVDLVTLPKDTSEAENVPECFAWVGKTEFNKEMNGLERTNVLLQAAFASPGAYDLTSRLAIFVKFREEMILQSCQIEASVIVS